MSTSTRESCSRIASAACWLAARSGRFSDVLPAARWRERKMGGEKRTQCNGAHERTSTTCDRAANDTSSARKNSAQQRDAERRHSECEILRTHTHTAPSSSSIGAVSSLAAFDSSRKLTIMSWSASKRSTNVRSTHRRRTQVRSKQTQWCANNSNRNAGVATHASAREHVSALADRHQHFASTENAPRPRSAR